MYSLDTNVFIDWQARYYPADVFASLVRAMAGLIATGGCAAVHLVHEEIDAVGTPDLRVWAANQTGLFLSLAPEIQVEGAAIEA